MARESHALYAAVSGDTPIALARVKTWNAGDTLTAADLNAEFNNILNNPTSLINLSAAGDVCIVSSAAAVTRLAIGSAGQAVTVSTGLLPVWSAPVLQSYLAGCQITAMTVSSSGTITHSSGVATDGTNVTSMVLSSALIGTTTGAFVAGNNQPKLQVSPLTASTSYHIYVISSALGGSVDVLYSSSTSPTLPTGFSKSRRVGSFITTSSGGLLQMTQDGDYFSLSTAPIQDVNITNPGTAAVTRTLTVPTGVNVIAIMGVQYGAVATNPFILFSDLADTDVAASASAFTVAANSGTFQTASQVTTRTNTSAQIRTRFSASSTGDPLIIDTQGWFDSRGRNS